VADYNLWSSNEHNAAYETETKTDRLFQEGKVFPPPDHVERLAKYKRFTMLNEGRHYEVYHRARTILDNAKQQEQLKKLYMAVNIIDILTTKPADLMFQEAPSYESGDDHDTQETLDNIVSRNRLNLLGHEIVTGAGIRGDAFIKTYFDYLEDVSELPFIPKNMRMEPIIESQDPSTVFPELARGSRKKFKAVNIATVEWVRNPSTRKDEAFLNVERHIAGFIEYQRYRLEPLGPEGYDTRYGVGIPSFRIGREVPTGKPESLIATGVPQILIRHVPYKSDDSGWEGRGTVENIESLIGAVNDRLVQIDYILMKHSDPNMYGPDLDAAETLSSGGKYIPVRKDEVEPSYMVWNSQLEGAFKELDYLLSLIYQISETPQWLFGQVVSNGASAGGTGTSHTDSTAIKSRFMPILSKVKRIRTHVDYAFRDALEAAMYLDNEGNKDVRDFKNYPPIYPNITWKDGLPQDEKELAEIMEIRTGGRPTLDVINAIKRQEDVNTAEAEKIRAAIEADEESDLMVDGSIFNQETEHIQIDDEELDTGVDE
jgi:hypothetical protein